MAAASLLAVVFCIGFVWPLVFALAKLLLVFLLLEILVEIIYLFALNSKLEAKRIVNEKLSNGDSNTITLEIEGSFPLKVELRIVEEFPIQLQLRNQEFYLSPKSKSFEEQIQYEVEPKERGEYHFGNIRMGTKVLLGFIERFFTSNCDQMVKVYPSIVQYKRFAFLNQANRLDEAGVKRLRRIGSSSEFDQIKEYRIGDDVKRINWKASARKNALMVNQYEDEKAQQIFLALDKGRMMHMPFGGLSLFDYSVNAALVMAGIAQSKSDKVGLITFSDLIGSWLPPSHRSSQIGLINEALYHQKTRLRETDYKRLLMNIRKQIRGRSMIVLFTNFESKESLQNQLKYLRAIARYHLLVCVIFENTELQEKANLKVNNRDDFFDQSVAEHQVLEKKLIYQELRQHGIQCIITKPEDLTVNTINKYLELKSRGMI